MREHTQGLEQGSSGWTRWGTEKNPPGQNPPYDRALMSTTGYCIAYEKLRILGFYRELKH